MKPILEKLRGGDRRSIGRSDEVVEHVLRSPLLFHDLFQGFYQEDVVIRMRTADAIEKITAKKPELLIPYKTDFLNLITQIDQIEVLWHFAQIIPRLPLTPEERTAAFHIVEGYLSNKSAIVQASSLQCLYELALQQSDLRDIAIRHLQQGQKSKHKAVQTRCRKLLSEKLI